MSWICFSTGSVLESLLPVLTQHQSQHFLSNQKPLVQLTRQGLTRLDSDPLVFHYKLIVLCLRACRNVITDSHLYNVTCSCPTLFSMVSQSFLRFSWWGGHAEESGSVCLETSWVLGWSESESEVKKIVRSICLTSCRISSTWVCCTKKYQCYERHHV